MKNLSYLIFIVFILSCADNAEKKTAVNTGAIHNPDSNIIEYARHIEISQPGNEVYFIRILNPWNQDADLATYLVKNSMNDFSDTTIRADFEITLPAKTIASMSLPVLGMIANLDSREMVIASSEPQLIYDSVIYNKYLNKEIVDLGNGMENPVETIIELNPDLLIKFIYQQQDPGDIKISGAGIPIAYVIEFMEDHPLGRAEWIKFIGILTGKFQEADSLFSMIESSYEQLKEEYSKVTTKPGVLIGFSYKGTWYSPGGRSYMANLVKDAGGSYIWTDDTTRGGRPLSLEKVMEDQASAEIWLNANTSTLDELLEVDSRFQVINAFRNNKVYHYNKRINPGGGLDYHENGVIRPDILLQDLIMIFHPEIYNGLPETTYWRKLD